MKTAPPIHEISATRRETVGLELATENGGPAEKATTNYIYIRRLEHLASSDLAIVGGKNASLGELLQHLGEAGVKVPPGFATTAHAYRRFLRVNAIDSEIRRRLDALEAGRASLADTGRAIRGLIAGGRWPVDVAVAIRRAYRELALDSGVADVPVAVRASATAEDLPEASFAGQLESFLNVRGEDAVLAACHRCFASLFTDRVIRRAHACGRQVGICGQAPSDHPEFAAFLVEAGIDSISVTPDCVLTTLRRVAEVEEAAQNTASKEGTRS